MLSLLVLGMLKKQKEKKKNEKRWKIVDKVKKKKWKKTKKDRPKEECWGKEVEVKMVRVEKEVHLKCGWKFFDKFCEILPNGGQNQKWCLKKKN